MSDQYRIPQHARIMLGTVIPDTTNAEYCYLISGELEPKAFHFDITAAAASQWVKNGELSFAMALHAARSGYCVRFHTWHQDARLFYNQQTNSLRLDDGLGTIYRWIMDPDEIMVDQWSITDVALLS